MNRLKHVESGGFVDTPEQRDRWFKRKLTKVGIVGSIILLMLSLLVLTSVAEQDGSHASSLASEDRVATHQVARSLASESYEMTMTAVPISDTRVEFAVSTNAPLPLQIMADVTLAGQLDHETWIGEQEKVVLANETTVFVLDTTANGKRLPAGHYIAEVAFYARWGADGNAAAQDVPNMSASQEITLGGSGETSEHAREKARMQRWVLGELDLSRSWSDSELKAQLGQFELYASPNAIRSVIYYFPDADISLVVDPARGKVYTYEIGRSY